MRIAISARAVLRIMVVMILILVALSLVSVFIEFGFKRTDLTGWRVLDRLFNVDRELNIPTFYSTFELMLASTLLAVIGWVKSRNNLAYGRHWLAMAVVFLYLSIDEFALIHESATKVLRGPVSGFWTLPDPWVLIGAPATLAFAVAFRKLLWSLPRRIRGLFILAGTTFVGGAIGLEMVAAVYQHGHGMENLTYALIENGEEFMEMMGVAIFIYALLRYLAEEMSSLSIVFSLHPSHSVDPSNGIRNRVERE